MRLTWNWKLKPYPDLRQIMAARYNTDAQWSKDDQDWIAEKRIRRWCRNNLYWNPGPGSDVGIGNTMDAHRIAQWWLDRQNDNDGKGPRFSCGTLKNFYIGLCAANGICAHGLIACSAKTGAPDHIARVWDPVHKKWMMVWPYANSQVVSAVTGVPLDYPEFVDLSKRNQVIYSSETGGYPNWWDEDVERRERLSQFIGWPQFWGGCAYELGNACHVEYESVPLVWVIKGPMDFGGGTVVDYDLDHPEDLTPIPPQ